MTKTSNKSQNTCTVLFDGSCSMCSGIVNKIDHSSQNNKFTAVDLTKTAQLPQGISRAAANKEIHVIDSAGKVHKNADAMLKILEFYPRWRWLARIGRWPGIHGLLRLGYAVAARYRHFIYGPPARLFWVKIIVCLGLLTGVLASTPAWLSGGGFPLVPLFSWLPQFSFSLSLLLFGAFLVSILAVIIARNPRTPIFVTAALALVLAVLDQNRLHPWVYQYIFMLIALTFFSWRSHNDSRNSATLNICRLIVVGIYFYSGLQKVNPDFMNSVFPWLISPLTAILGDQNWTGIFLLGGILAPFVELGLGLALLSNRFRNPAVLLLCGMHLFILLCIGPLGHGWNSSVWPWNLAMISLLFVLFWNVKNIPWYSIAWIRGFAFQKIALLAFAILPLLSFFNLWDSYLSSSLYSGNIAQAVIYLQPGAAQKLPPSISQYGTWQNDRMRLSPQTWAVGENNLPPYPEVRVYKAIAGSLCKQYGFYGDQLQLHVVDKRSWLRRNEVQSFTCASL